MKTSSTILLCVLLLAFLSACAPSTSPLPPSPTRRGDEGEVTATPPPTATATATPTMTATRTATATNTPPPPTATPKPTDVPRTPTKDAYTAALEQAMNRPIAPFPPKSETWSGPINWNEQIPGQSMKNVIDFRMGNDPLGYRTVGFWKFKDKNQFDVAMGPGGSGAQSDSVNAYGFEVLRGWSLPYADTSGNQVIDMIARTRNGKGELVTLRLVAKPGNVSLSLNTPVGGIYDDPCCVDLLRRDSDGKPTTYNIFQAGDAMLISVSSKVVLIENAPTSSITTIPIDARFSVSAYPFSKTTK